MQHTLEVSHKARLAFEAMLAKRVVFNANTKILAILLLMLIEYRVPCN